MKQPPKIERFAVLADPKKVIAWKEYLHLSRWVQGNYRGYPDGCCMVGALADGVYAGSVQQAEKSTEFFLVEDILRSDNWYGSVPQWNDQRGRTKDEVLALIDRAMAEIIKVKGSGGE